MLGNLLERHPGGSFLWVDDRFEAGRVNRAYRHVPSNTKAKLFVDFAEATAPFRTILADKTPSGGAGTQATASSDNAVDALRRLDQDSGCALSYAADMCLQLTHGLRQFPGVETRQGRVRAATLNGATKSWSVEIDEASDAATSDSAGGEQVRARSGEQARARSISTASTSRVVLCTGSSPTDHPLPVSIPGLSAFDLDDALSPAVLGRTLPKSEPSTVAVIGASHSAVLVLMNLVKLATTTHPQLRVRWLTRHPLRYAEYMDGWILRDNTGLKGAAAAWARENLEPEKLQAAGSVAGRIVEAVRYESGDEVATYERHLPGCNRYVHAIGYTRDPLPELNQRRTTSDSDSHDDKQSVPLRPNYDHESGAFADDKGKRIPGLYGAGIAWPERVTDPYGNVEYAVGFWKFMRFLKRVTPSWT